MAEQKALLLGVQPRAASLHERRCYRQMTRKAREKRLGGPNEFWENH